MNHQLSRLSSDELDSRLKNLVQQERDLLHDILLHIQEVDRRRLYLKLAHPSLFDYLTRHLGYSAGAAQRRIDAARLGRQLPQVIEKIQTGELNLSQIALVQQATRQCQKQSQRVSLEQTRALLSAIETKSSNETKAILAKSLDLPVLQTESLRPQRDDSVRLEFTLTAKQMAELERCRELLSSKLKHLQWADVITALCQDYLRRKDPAQVEARIQKKRTEPKVEAVTEASISTTEVKTESPSLAEMRTINLPATEVRTKCTSTAEMGAKSTSTAEVDAKKNPRLMAGAAESPKLSSRYPSPEGLGGGHCQIANQARTQTQTMAVARPTKRHVLLRQAHCQFQTPDGHKCGSRYRLQIDHIQPRWAGGDNTLRNLQVLCAAHNRQRYLEQTGRVAAGLDPDGIAKSALRGSP